MLKNKRPASRRMSLKDVLDKRFRRDTSIPEFRCYNLLKSRYVPTLRDFKSLIEDISELKIETESKVSSGSDSDTKSEIEYKFNFDIHYFNNETLLHVSSSRGLKKIVEYIIQQGADINSLNENDLTPLHEAAAAGYTNICSILIKNGSKINAPSKLYNMPIHYAIAHGHRDTVKLLIRNNCELNIPNKQGDYPFRLILEHMSDISETILDKRKQAIARVPFNRNKEHYITDKNPLDNLSSPKSLIITSKAVLRESTFRKKNRVMPFHKENEHLINVRNALRAVHTKNSRNSPALIPAEFNKDIDQDLEKEFSEERCILWEYDYRDFDDTFFRRIIDKGDSNILAHPWTQKLLDFYWLSFGKKLFRKQLISYVFYTLLFTLTSIMYKYIPKEPIINETYNNSFTNKEMINSDTTIITVVYIIDILLVLFNILYTINELWEVCKVDKYAKYFKNKWNIFDIFQSVLVFCIIPLKASDPNSAIVVMSLLAPLFWIKLLNFARGFRNVGPLVRVLFKMMSDIYHFLVIFAIFQIGFSHSFFILYGNTHKGYLSIVDTMMTVFNINLGNPDYDTIRESENHIWGTIIYVIFSVISVVTLLNILIAILTDSYTNVTSKAEKEWKVERAKLILTLQKNIWACRQKFITVEDINSLYSIEKDEPVEGIGYLKKISMI